MSMRTSNFCTNFTFYERQLNHKQVRRNVTAYVYYFLEQLAQDIQLLEGHQFVAYLCNITYKYMY